MRRAAVLIAFLLLLLPARPARADVLEGWPCPGCVTVTPSSPARDAGPPDGAREGAPRPLLVALHGDGGALAPILRAWRGAAEAEGAILLVPSCPRTLGCPGGSWWRWLQTSGHDPGWLGAQVDAVAARFAVDPRHVVAAGYSGGATYLGWYAPTHPERFAAVAHVAGGAPFASSCPTCKLPVLFVLGAADPMLVPYTRPLRDWYTACGGHEVVWETLRGVTHDSILDVLQAGRSRSILTWLLSHPASCAGALPAALGAADAGTDVPPSSPPGSGPAPQARAASSAPPAAPPPVPPAAAGCTCDVAGGGAPPLAASLGALAWLLAARRRRRAR